MSIMQEKAMERLISRIIRSYEIEHYGDYDLITNSRLSSAKEVSELAETILLNIRESNDPFNGWVNTTDEHQRVLFQDRQESPMFFAKRKWMTREKLVEFLERATLRENNTGINEIRSKKYDRNYNSVLNELSISHEVTEIVGNIEGQEIAGKYGYSALIYGEPIIGIINRKTGDKFMIYWHLGVHISLADSAIDDKAHMLVRELRKIFINYKIDPEDMGETQLLITTDKDGHDVLNLIDIEAFTRISE